MVVGCPRCKTRLKVPDEKIKPEGSRFKCPKCGAILVVRKPAAKTAKPIDRNRIVVAHANPNVAAGIQSALSGKGYRVGGAVDGVSAMVRAMKERPFLAILDVSLPKISGFEVCKRLKTNPETKEMKIILTGSRADEDKKYAVYGADGYLNEQRIGEDLLPVMDSVLGVKKEVSAPEKFSAPPVSAPLPPEVKADAGVERAKRLLRAIMSDIEFYSRAKLEEALRNDNFHSVFAKELKEGIKLYEYKIAPDVRSKGDFFNEGVNEFIDKKKKALGLQQ